MKWTLVTGGAKNLGAAICLELAKQGHAVAVHYNTSEEEAQLVVEKCSNYQVPAQAIQGDFSTFESTQRFIKEYQRHFAETKNLINNVGNYLLGSSLKTSICQWHDLFQTNLHAPYCLIKNLLPSIKKWKGSIINLGVAGLNANRADTYATAYTISKSGLLMLTKSLALELAADQVRVNMISPGYLEESMDLPHPLTKIPMQRAGHRDEVAQLIGYLLSNQASYITGQNIEIAGGTRL
ncbi:3-oxoacyl-[acyl-carrier-protein] reductase FabG|uniref:SDR family oxidoreductase n=1 Tax=Neochlamydia sp. AcF84 TaxID=2315858 RepID=UPI00140A6188|nr:SDR family oxidoreductase [Neochlamydia sp. AcF84]NGY94688.1 3-oxoacyl-[acyl-carrier-protein] reductase FabG [Neochlamydia sp. AcF84]